MAKYPPNRFLYSIACIEDTQTTYYGLSGYTTTNQLLAPKLPRFQCSRIKKRLKIARPQATLVIFPRDVPIDSKDPYSRPKTAAKPPE